MNLPNKLTVFRILMIPVFMVLALVPFDLGSIQGWGSQVDSRMFLAMLVFAVASLTDYLDGYLARKNNLTTNFGKFADPLADKMLVMTAFIILVELGMAPAWVVAIIVCRELAVTGLRLILVEQGGTVLAAALPGKIKTVTQMFAIIFLLIDNFPLQAISLPLGQILLYTCLFFTIYSGIDYFWNARHIFKGSM
ncbi:CDP-diacylglycerol--glycerol-3-phosphate 3-phosphatidyltransferase [Alloiococcus otitis]|uniref:CDP-diacylglycerol--glycerol-3-phosphate 3-phosphatidyltransferase n=1 Tax=Alloiococcus otitis ATCC 51267 TaxID=883081 RepID=K9EF06_9LACT|nr:CDP-diacylglycerol--glycerol-3-phosphate 3-phosphatidyltransferase [Alloiococcus otitis]EKU94416.1 CDP-diacylglycerol-glycerol-3-phosphate 3-phosphatidyltransferase [Alloiococcus otitis ATCC 51267]SUU81392.1 CDP-diacylglycerol--glycerol-3-phosphate 3-phosphatidyltransferase [Alloiococcus otitis]